MLARRVRTLAGASVATVLLLGMGSYAFVRHIREQRVQAELKLEEERRGVETEANRKVEEAEKLRLAGLKAEQERKARATAEAEAKHKSEEAEQQQVAALKAEEDSKAKEAVQIDPKSALAFIARGDAYTNKADNDRAIADYNEAIQLDPKNALALSDRGVAYANKGDNDRAMADFNEAIRLDPKRC